MRNVCGCTPASSAATEMMYSARSSAFTGHSRSRSRGLHRAELRFVPSSLVTLALAPVGYAEQSSASFPLHCSHPQVGARVRRQRLRERFDGLACFAFELRRHRDVERHQQIAVATLRLRDAAPADTDRLAALGSLRHLHGHGLVERRDLHLRAECRLGECDGEPKREVLALAPEDRVRVHVHHHVEIPWRPAVAPRAAAALHTDALSVVDTGRDANLDLAGPHLDPVTLAGRAALLDDLAAPAATRAHLGHRERALVPGDHADTATLGARFRHRAGLRSRAATRRAHRVGGEAHRRGDAVHRLEEVEVQLRLEVETAPRPARSVATCPPARAAAEQVAEQVAEATDVLEVDRLAASRATGSPEAAEPAGAAESARAADP